MTRPALTLDLRPPDNSLSLSSDPACLSFDFAPALRGDPGVPGDGSGGALTPAAIGALAVSLRLAEFDTETARAAARANLGLQNIDGGTF